MMTLPWTASAQVNWANGEIIFHLNEGANPIRQANCYLMKCYTHDTRKSAYAALSSLKAQYTRFNSKEDRR